MRILILALPLFIAACATSGVVNTAAPVVPYIPPDIAQRGSDVSVVGEVAAGAQFVGNVEAHACQKLQYDPVPSDELALAMLKAEAAAVGATSITEVKLQTSNVDFARNCFTTIHATGKAYR